MTPAPSRRRFQWSLRTLFVVVTVLCVWLGWNVDRVQKRKRLVVWSINHGVRFNVDETWDVATGWRTVELNENQGRPPANTRHLKTTGISWFRRQCLGDQPLDSIWVPGVWRNEPETHQITEAFPEAKIIIGADR